MILLPMLTTACLPGSVTVTPDTPGSLAGGTVVVSIRLRSGRTRLRLGENYTVYKGRLPQGRFLKRPGAVRPYITEGFRDRREQRT
jgi:hypothetical protein